MATTSETKDTQSTGGSTTNGGSQTSQGGTTTSQNGGTTPTGGTTPAGGPGGTDHAVTGGGNGGESQGGQTSSSEGSSSTGQGGSSTPSSSTPTGGSMASARVSDITSVPGYSGESSNQQAAPQSSGGLMSTAREEDRRSVYSYAGNSPTNQAREVVSPQSRQGLGYTTVEMDDGSIVRTDGARGDRNNNPGNIEFGNFARENGAIGTDGRFAVFPDAETGRLAQESLIFDNPRYSQKTIADAITMYAPPFENDTNAYINVVATAAGVPPGTRMSELSPDQRQRVLDAMAVHEGYRPGNVRQNTLREGIGFPSAEEMRTDFGPAGGRGRGGLLTQIAQAAPVPQARPEPPPAPVPEPNPLRQDDPFAGMVPAEEAITAPSYAPQPPVTQGVEPPRPRAAPDRFAERYLGRGPTTRPNNGPVERGPSGPLSRPNNGTVEIGPSGPLSRPNNGALATPATPQAPAGPTSRPNNGGLLSAIGLDTAGAEERIGGALSRMEPGDVSLPNRGLLSGGPTGRPNNGPVGGPPSQGAIGRRVDIGYLDAFGGEADPALGEALDAAVTRRDEAVTPPAFTEPPREIASAPTPPVASPPAPAGEMPETFDDAPPAAAEEEPPGFNWNRAMIGASLGGAVGGPMGALAGGLFGGYSERLMDGMKPDGRFMSTYLGGGDGSASDITDPAQRSSGRNGLMPRPEEPAKPKPKPKAPAKRRPVDDTWRPKPKDRFGEDYERYM